MAEIYASRPGLVAAAGFYIVWIPLGSGPPLVLSQWYVGRVIVALLVPLVVLAWGFYASLGGQPIFGSAERSRATSVFYNR